MGFYLLANSNFVYAPHFEGDDARVGRIAVKLSESNKLPAIFGNGMGEDIQPS